MMTFPKFVNLMVLVSFVLAPSWRPIYGNEVLDPFRSQDAAGNKAREFYVGGSLSKPLITVNIINGVGSPGVYHIPQGTNLAELLALAGGASRTADLTEVSLRSVRSDKSPVRLIDLAALTANGDPLPVLSNRDMLMIADKPSLDRTLQWVSLASIVIGIVSAIIVIQNSSR